MIPIVLVDETSQPPELLAKVKDALNVQLKRDLARPPPHGYGIMASVRVASAKHPPHKEDWVLALSEVPDIRDALGYHDRTPTGLPLMKVFPNVDPSEPWSITASHEVLETLVDPELALCFQDPTGKFWCGEVADPVEADSYEINGIKVSNFVLPCYYQPTTTGGAPLDYLGLVQRPYEIRPGGYNQYWSGTRWKIVTSSRGLSPARLKLRALKLGRGRERNAKNAPYSYAGSVVRVIDGDTFIACLEATFSREVDLGFGIIDRILLSKRTEQKIRLAGIDAPEIGTPEGVVAKAALEAILASSFAVTTHGQDKYGRWLGSVAVDTGPDGVIDVSAYLVAKGLAQRYAK